MANSSEPLAQNSTERSCIVCRESDEKQALIRLALIDDQLCFDLRHKLPGRGYYICAKKSCIDKAFAGIIKRATKHDASEIAKSADDFVRDVLLPGLRKRNIECLSSGFQSGQLILGADAVEQAAKENKLACYIMARDASDAAQQKYQMNAERKNLPCITGQFTGAFYGRLFNKSDKMVLGWLPGALCDIWMECNSATQQLMADYKEIISHQESAEDTEDEELRVIEQFQIQLPSE